MKDKTLFLSSVLVAFVFGVLSTYLFMTKQQMDQILQAKQSETSYIENTGLNATDQESNVNSSEHSTNQNVINSSPDNANSKGSNTSSINDYSQQQALDIVNTMPDYVLGQYVDRFMTKGASEVIRDKRRFAERAVEELYKENDNQPLVGDVKLSLTPSMPATSLDTSILNKDIKLFAHLDTNGKIPTSAFVFVKWVNNETGQVLLFEKKNIIANSNQNWVSFKPYEGWEPGSYDIRFYQFTSELQPVAQLTYQIFNVDES